MITIYGPGAEDTAGLGLGILQPDSCVVTEVAGGRYDLTLTHPITPDGRWQLLKPDAVLKVPVPLRESPVIALQQSGRTVTEKVDTPLHAAARAVTPCPVYAFADGTGRRALLPAGTAAEVLGRKGDLLLVAAAGVTGYAPAEALEETEASPRTVADSAGAYTVYGAPGQIRPQLFRVTEVTVDTAARQVTARALHIAYDLACAMLTGCDLTASTDALPEQLTALRSAMVGRYDGQLIAGVTDSYSGDIGWRNPVRALLDPEEGIVRQLRLRVVRDDLDWYLLPDGTVDRGVTVAYGKNLTGLSWTESTEDLVTRIIPVASKGGERTLTSAVWLDSPRVGDWAVPHVSLLEGGSDADETQLTAAARAELDRGCDTVPAVLTVDFLLLGDTEEYAAYRALQQVYLYDTVTVEHAPTGLKTAARVCGYTWDAILQRYDRLTLGDPFQKEKPLVSGYQLPADPATAARLAAGLMGSAAFAKAVRAAVE